MFKNPEPKSKLIERTAMEFAATFYEEQRGRGLTSKHKNARSYAKANFEKFLAPAISILTDMLSRSNVAPTMKEEIYTALTERAANEDLKFMDAKRPIPLTSKFVLPEEYRRKRTH